MQINANPAPAEEVKALVSDMGQPGGAPVDTIDEDPPMMQSLSLGALQARQAARMGAGAAAAPGESPRPLYAEEVGTSVMDKATSDEMLMKSQFSNLSAQTPEERARIGARMGAQQGLRSNGVVGSIIGAGVGSMAARAAGMLQSGEHEDGVRNQRVLSTLSTMGVVGRDSTIDFGEDGKSPLLTADPSMRLSNLGSFGQGKDRSLYEIDSTNPYSTRASSVARPLALYLTQGMLGYRDRKNPRDEAAAKNTLGVLTNSLLQDTNSIDTVNRRARMLVDKMGLDENKIRTYFNANKTMFNKEEAESLRAGLDTLFGESK